MWIERLMAGISHQHVLSYNPKEIPVPERVQGSLVSGSKISILDGYLG